MSLIENKYYIIRKGDFATNANTKILYSLFALTLCCEEYITTKQLDCFYIMTGSTGIWSIIEAYLHYTKTRIIDKMIITSGKDIYELPHFLGIILQGFQEGGFITTAGLYFGDRFFQLKYFIYLQLMIYFIIFNISYKRKLQIASRRQVNTPGSLSLMGISTLYNIYHLYSHPQHFKRRFMMFMVMVYISSVWTIMSWYKGFRKVEVHILNNNETYSKKNHNIMDTIYVLGYDVIFEIGVAYLCFYNMFII